jgi:hypothetical protein
MGFRQITHPGDCAFGIRWDLETDREHSDLPSR